MKRNILYRFSALTFLLFCLPGPYAQESAAVLDIAPGQAVSEGKEAVVLDKKKANPSLSLPMAAVKGGTFQMGSTDGGSNEKPVHSVTVQDFFISPYEVTHTDFLEFLNAAGVNTSGSYNGNEVIDMDDSDCAIGYMKNGFYFKGSGYVDVQNCPVIEVTWYGALEYCNWLSRKDDLTPAYTIDGTHVTWDKNANGYRLPTEAEWEYAARGGSMGEGYAYAGSNTIGDVAWYSSNSSSKTHPVGRKQANELGLYDMSGNVREWCWDKYDVGYYSNSPPTDPPGPSATAGPASALEGRVLRGGSWHANASSCRAASRGRNNAGLSNVTDCGFRVVLSGKQDFR